MFPFGNFRKTRRPASHNPRRPRPDGLEPLEGRQMLSASHNVGGPPQGGPAAFGGSPDQSAIALSLTPAAVQTGLATLATTDGLTAPASTAPVSLGNQDGVETYSVTINSTGTVSRLTVDAAGAPVTAPTQSTTTFAALATAPAAEITAIATAKSLTAPTADTVVNVTTTAAGVATYSVALAPAAVPVTTTTPTTPTATAADEADTGFDAPPSFGLAVMVDAAGNPVGNQQLPLSVFSTTIQNALTAGAPTGATALTSTSTVDVRTADGLTTYSVKYTVSGTDTTVLVNAAGATMTPASRTTADFSTLPSAAQTELQALAAAKGYTATIAATQSVDVYTEVGGTTTLYAVTLSVADATTTTTSSTTATHDETFVVDASGDPTVLPAGDAIPGGFEGGSPGQSGPPSGGGHGDPGHGGGGGATGGDPGSWGGSTGGSSTGGSSGTSTTTPTPTSTTPTPAKLGASGGSPAVFNALNSINLPGVPTLGPALSLFASVSSDATVKSDVAQLKADAAALRSTTQGLSAADKATLRADEKALGAAIKALSATLGPAQKTLKSDAAKYAATLRADAKSIRKDHANATALATDEAKLASDQAAAFAALSADLDALKALVSADAGVTAAQSKLATDLPTVAAAGATIVSDESKLVTDIGSAIASA